MSCSEATCLWCEAALCELPSCHVLSRHDLRVMSRDRPVLLSHLVSSPIVFHVTSVMWWHAMASRVTYSTSRRVRSCHVMSSHLHSYMSRHVTNLPTELPVSNWVPTNFSLKSLLYPYSNLWYLKINCYNNSDFRFELEFNLLPIKNKSKFLLRKKFSSLCSYSKFFLF